MKKFLNRFIFVYGLFLGVGIGYDKEEKLIVIALPFMGVGINIDKQNENRQLSEKTTEKSKKK